MHKKGRYTEYEIEYIKAHYKTKTDTEIGKVLQRDSISIARKRDSLGLKKITGRPTKESVEEARLIKPESQADREIYATLSPLQKKMLFRQKFEGTSRYSAICEVLTQDEVDFYSERFLDYVFTFETILTHEEDTLHLAIMELIRSKRMLRRQREIREAIEDGQPIVGAGLEVLDRQYKDSVDTFNRLMSSLSATRQQRLAKDKENRLSIVSAVQSLQDEYNRKRVGEEAAIIEAAAKAVKQDMRTKNYLLD